MTRLGSRSRPQLWLAGVERAHELIAYGLVSEDGDTTITSTFEGDENRPHYLTGEAYQETASAALWRFTRQHSGEEVPFILAPNGNPEPSADAPLYVGRVVVGPKPDLGGATSDNWFRYQFAWRLAAEPDEITDLEDLEEWEAANG